MLALVAVLIPTTNRQACCAAVAAVLLMAIDRQACCAAVAVVLIMAINRQACCVAVAAHQQDAAVMQGRRVRMCVWTSVEPMAGMAAANRGLLGGPAKLAALR